jgi:hypothetical protein
MSLLPLNADFFIVGDNILPPSDKERVESFYHPKKSLWNTIEDRPTAHHMNTVRMFQRIYECDQLRQQYELDHNITYDCVIRIRPDLIFTRSIQTKSIESIKSGYLYFGQSDGFKLTHDKPYFYREYSLSDQFFLASSDDMKKVTSLYLKLEQSECPTCLAEIVFTELVRINYPQLTFGIINTFSYLCSKNVYELSYIKGLSKIYKSLVADKLYYAKNLLPCLNKYKDSTIIFRH